MADRIQEMYDSLPDDDTLLDFDPFLIGDGSAELMKGQGRRSKKTSQLIGIFSVDDLAEKYVEKEVIESDLGSWGDQFKSIEVDVKDYFLQEKKRSYQVFDYLKVVSENAEGLVREEDLIVSDDDHYLLDYMSGKGELDKYLVESIAQLSAWGDMGFKEVKFFKKCVCPLCNASDRSVHNLLNLIKHYGSGVPHLHNVCECNYLPVIRTRNTYVDIPEIEINGTLYINFPSEFKSLVEDLTISVKKVEFRDLSKIKGWSGECVLDRDGELLVHSGYLGEFSPFEYLESWLRSDGVGESSDDVLYYKGREVRLKDGVYIDIATNEVVEI